jgi:hypothetical protein
MRKRRYVYNWEQSYFYMQHGIMPIERPQIHFKTGNIFFVFDYIDTKRVHDLWCTREKAI